MRQASSQTKRRFGPFKELREDLASGYTVVDWGMVVKIVLGVSVYVIGATLWSVFLFVPWLGVPATIGLNLLTAACTLWGFLNDSGDGWPPRPHLPEVRDDA